jgi:hypothetical protein
MRSADGSCATRLATVHAARPLLRKLTPLLRPALWWNHSWAIARAIDGLEPYARPGQAPPETDTTARR